jgi:hypothetical protein
MFGAGSDTYEIAIHEAAHAIVALALPKGWLISIKINPSSSKNDGTTQCGSIDTHEDAVIFLAGYAAEDALLGKTGAGRDTREFGNAEALVGPDMMEQCWSEATQLVLDNEAAIRAVADELMATRDENDNSRMSGERAREIFEQCKSGAYAQPQQQAQLIPAEPQEELMPAPVTAETIDEDLRLAIHESGHAAAVCDVDGYLHSIELNSDGGGVTTHDARSPVVDLAGYAAVLELLNYDEPYEKHNTDFEKAEDFAGSEFMSYLPQARQVVRKHEAAIRRIAEELRQTRYMSGERAYELFNESNRSNVMTPQNQIPQQPPVQQPQGQLQYAPAPYRGYPPPRRPNWGKRLGIFFCNVFIMVLLGCFTIPAFWEHIQSLNPEFVKTAMVGACAGEVMLLFISFWQAFDKSMKVRQLAIVFEFLLAGVIIVHAAALWGLKDGTVRQANKEQAMTGAAERLSKTQMEAASGQYRTQTQRQIAADTRNKVLDEIKNRDQAIHSATFMPEWYMNGPMYLAIFLVVLLSNVVLGWLHVKADPRDIDSDFDGIADWQQQQYQQPMYYPQPQYAPAPQYQPQPYAPQQPQVGGSDPGQLGQMPPINGRSH